MLPNLFSLFQNENVCAWAGSCKFSLTGAAVTDVQSCNLAQEASPSLSLHTGAHSQHLGLVPVFPAPIFLGKDGSQRIDVLVHGLLIAEPPSLLSHPTFQSCAGMAVLCFGGAGTWNVA